MAADDSANIETTSTRFVYENRWMRVREDTIRRRDGWDLWRRREAGFRATVRTTPAVLSGPAGRHRPGLGASPCSTRFAVRIGESQAHFAFDETASSASTRGSVMSTRSRHSAIDG